MEQYEKLVRDLVDDCETNVSEESIDLLVKLMDDLVEDIGGLDNSEELRESDVLFFVGYATGMDESGEDIYDLSAELMNNYKV